MAAVVRLKITSGEPELRTGGRGSGLENNRPGTEQGVHSASPVLSAGCWSFEEWKSGEQRAQGGTLEVPELAKAKPREAGLLLLHRAEGMICFPAWQMRFQRVKAETHLIESVRSPAAVVFLPPQWSVARSV